MTLIIRMIKSNSTHYRFKPISFLFFFRSRGTEEKKISIHEKEIRASRGGKTK